MSTKYDSDYLSHELFTGKTGLIDTGHHRIVRVSDELVIELLSRSSGIRGPNTRFRFRENQRIHREVGTAVFLDNELG